MFAGHIPPNQWPPASRGPLPPPMPGISDVVKDLNSAAEMLIFKHVWHKNQCLDNIRVAEVFIAMAREKLEKL